MDGIKKCIRDYPRALRVGFLVGVLCQSPAYAAGSLKDQQVEKETDRPTVVTHESPSTFPRLILDFMKLDHTPSIDEICPSDSCVAVDIRRKVTDEGTSSGFVAAVLVPAGVTSQIDTPAPGPADLLALGMIVIGGITYMTYVQQSALDSGGPTITAWLGGHALVSSQDYVPSSWVPIQSSLELWMSDSIAFEAYGRHHLRPPYAPPPPIFPIPQGAEVAQKSEAWRAWQTSLASNQFISVMDESVIVLFEKYGVDILNPFIQNQLPRHLLRLLENEAFAAGLLELFNTYSNALEKAIPKPFSVGLKEMKDRLGECLRHPLGWAYFIAAVGFAAPPVSSLLIGAMMALDPVDNPSEWMRSVDTLLFGIHGLTVLAGFILLPNASNMWKKFNQCLQLGKDAVVLDPEEISIIKTGATALAYTMVIQPGFVLGRWMNKADDSRK